MKHGNAAFVRDNAEHDAMWDCPRPYAEECPFLSVIRDIET